MSELDAATQARNADALIRRQIVAGAKAVGILGALLNTGGLANCTEGTRRAAKDAIGEWLGVPYPQHCRHADKCAGLGSCPRDPICID